MNTDDREQIHDLLDHETPTGDADTLRRVATYRAALDRLERSRVSAPLTLRHRIVTALPARQRPAFLDWLQGLLPARRQWALPALVGAAVALLLVWGLPRTTPEAATTRVVVHFQMHAPGAQRVELLGDFNRWTPGVVQLSGPDASGHWTADIELPEGRYEYQFLVDGNVWVTDPNASLLRPDGFGRDNAVVHVVNERT